MKSTKRIVAPPPNEELEPWNVVDQYDCFHVFFSPACSFGAFAYIHEVIVAA